MENIKDPRKRSDLLRERNQIVKDIHTEFRSLNIEIPTVVEKKSEEFASLLEDLADGDSGEGRTEDA